MLSTTEHQRLNEYIENIDVTDASRIFNALGEPNRCLIFRTLIKQNKACVGQIARTVKQSEPLTSQHLKVLLNAGVVNRMKVGKNVYYQVNDQDSLVKALSKAVSQKDVCN